MEKKRENKNKKPLKWVKEGLVVRIISDKYSNGKMYNKKVLIQTITNESSFLAIPYDKNTPQSSSVVVFPDLREKELETVLP